MSATNGKVALANNNTAATGPTASNVVDFIGFGTANAREGTATAPAPSNTTAAVRGPAGTGCSDTNQNGTDFTAVTPAPRNSATAVVSCGTPAPTLAATPTSLSGFTYVAGGGPSAEQSYSLSGSNLTAGPIAVTAPASFEVSLTTGGPFTPSVSVAYTAPTLAATTIFVRLAAGQPAGSIVGNATNVGGGASLNVLLSGNVTAPAVPTLTVSPATLGGFGYTAGAGPSGTQSYTISGSNLTGAPGDITVTAPTNYEVALSSTGPFVASLNLNYPTATLAATPVFVQLKAGLPVGSYGPETIANSGGGATTKNVTLNGAVSAVGGPCVSEGFDGAATALPAGFNFVGIAAGNTYTSTGNFGVSSPALQLDATGDIIVTPTLSNPTSVSFWVKGNGTNAGSSLIVEGFDGANFTTIATLSPLPTTGGVQTYSGLSSTFISIRFRYIKSNGNVAFDDVTVTCGANVPTITATPTTLGLGTTGVNVASSPQSFSLNASGLTAALLATAPAGTEISLTSTTGFGPSLSIAPVGGSVSARPVYVRLAATATAGAVSGQVDLTSAGTPPAAVAVSGNVTAGSVFYYKGSGPLNDFTNFGLNADGSGANPGGFTAAGFTYVVTGTAGTLDANWTVFGTGTKVVLAAGATLTIPTSFIFSGTLEQGANSTLVILNTGVGAISSITQAGQDASSTIDLAQTSSFTVPTTLTYENLKLTNSTKTFGGNFAAAVTVKGNLTLDNVQVGGSVANSTTAAANYSGVKLGGDLIQLAGTSYDVTRSFTLQMIRTGGTQTLYGNGFGAIAVYRLLDSGVSTTPPAAASASNTVTNAQQIVLSDVAFGTSTPAPTTLTVANLFTGGVLLANQFSSLTLNNGTTLQFALSGGGNFFTAHRGRLRLIDGCNLLLNRNTSSTFSLGNLFIDPNFNTCRNFLLNSTASGPANTLTLLGDLNVTGNLNLFNGTLVIGPNTLNLTGGLTSTGGLLNGSTTSNLTIGGSGSFGSLAFAPGFQVLRNLVLNRAPSGGTPAVLTLTAPLTVGETLDLSAGLITTTAANLLTLGYSATGGLLNGSAGSYIDGPLARGTTTGAATVGFPVGKGADYRPITLNTATQTSSPTYTAEVLAGTARTTAVTAPLTRVSAVRYFRLDPSATPSGYSGTVTLSFDTDDLVNFPGDASFVMAKRPTGGGPWVSAGRTGATSSGAGPYLAGTLESGPITGFSEFSLASTAPASNNAGATSNPLPVELLSFSARRTAAGPVALAWATASERNSARFDIERSLDGRTFERVGTVAAQGTKTTPTAYTYLDEKPTNSPTHQLTIYYRLRQVDLDGSGKYSAVRNVAGTDKELACYPNPARTVLFVPAVPGSRYRVLSLVGQALLGGEATSALAEVPVAALPPGTYLLELTTEAGRQVQRFTKE